MRTSASFTSAFNCLSTNCSGDCSSKNLPLPVPVRLGLLRLSPDELRVRVRRGRLFGWVTEWLIVHAWKACVPKGTGGSNPPPSAIVLLQLNDRSTRRASLIEERFFDVEVFGHGVSSKCETLHAIEPQVQALFRQRR